jgi:hypothetical protein
MSQQTAEGLFALDYARLFRKAAEQWREGPQLMEDDELGTHCGRLIIQAYERRYFPADPLVRELGELVECHRADGSGDRKTGMVAVKSRCPYNLFLDVAGGHSIRVMHDGEGHGTVLADPDVGTVLCGGLFPKLGPYLLNLPQHERNAFACERLAELIEARVKAAAAPESPDILRNRYFYDQRFNGKPDKAILADARREHPEWDCDMSIQGMRRNAESHQQRNDLPPIPPRRHPRRPRRAD